MKILASVAELKKWRTTVTGTVGFVPTMGALHEGHISLMRASTAKNSHTVVSIFVNPTQFLPGEDFARYPRRADADAKICELAGVDILFMPDAADIYPADPIMVTAPAIRGYIYEGAVRPGHFDGVLSVVLKLFGIVSPDRAYFGKKDAQQLLLITEMVRHLFLDVEIVPGETVRDADGLALSSRNAYLSADERTAALAIPRALKKAAKLARAGELETATLEDQMRDILTGLAVDYIAFTDRTLRPLTQLVLGESLILVAARAGKTRLIDNLWI